MRKINNKHVIAIDFLVVIVSLVIIAGLVGYTRPLVVSPVDDLLTKETAVLFEFEKANLILLDDNIQFSSPEKIHVKDNLIINLKPGTYFWKVEGTLPSEIRKLTIESEVDLRIRANGDSKSDSYEVMNGGNTKLDVNIFGADGNLIGSVVLDIDESEEVKEKFADKFIGGESNE